MSTRSVAFVFVLLLTLAPWAQAHQFEAAPAETWSFDPWVVVPLLLSAALYAVGVARLWRRAGKGRGLSVKQIGAFAGGWWALWLALVSPLDALGSASFAAHMIQHEVLMLIAAPLLVSGRPLVAWTWALPPAWRRAVGRGTRQRAFASGWALLTAPLTAWVVHALVLWAWHAPALFDAALLDETAHTLQHLSFLAAALLFWWSVIGRDARAAPGGAVLSLLGTMIHTGLLGALLTFAPTVWYAPYRERAVPAGLDALVDQQLGGLIMWVPAGAIYLLVALALVMRWLRPAIDARRPGAAL